MVAGAGAGIREEYRLLPVGTELWHVYPSVYDPLAFNPKSGNRFALPPPAGRSMYYAGDSSACALWEAVLRNLVIEPSQPQYVDPELVKERLIARIRLKQEVPVLDLRAPHFRRLIDDADRHSEWLRLRAVPERDYRQTHAAARELVTAAPRAAGLCWHSKQLGDATAHVFYSAPLTPVDAFEVLEVIALDSTQGWALIDQALAVVQVERMDGAALARRLAEELPPDDP